MSNATNRTRSSKDDALDMIRTGVQDLLTSEGWKEALAFRQRFHRYSLFNTLLIRSQRPAASYVAGYRAWLELGRQVQKGEKGIRILAPITKRDKDTDDQRIVGFRFVSVFDIDQTKGEPAPELARPQVLSGDSDEIQALTRRLETYLRERDVSVSYVYDLGGANGTFTPSENSIRVLHELPPLQALKTLAHEAAHYELEHTSTADEHRRSFGELEAETTAFLILNEFGLDASGYSFAYLAHWSIDEDLDDLIKAGDRAARVATRLSEAIRPPQTTPDAEAVLPLAT